MSIEIPVLRVSELPDAIPAHTLARVSGGRDLWSPPMSETPLDPIEGVWRCLQEVLDPEIPISLVELGLIYGVEFSENSARIRLTFTATACPCMAFIREDISDRLEQERWIERVEIEEVWDPPWTNERITPEGRARLRSLGVGVAL